MILTVALFLCALALGLFVIGQLSSYTAVAVIGAVMLLGVGVMITGTGLEYKSGQTVEEISNTTTEHTNQYTTVELPQRLPLGFLIMLAGGVLTLRAFNIEI